MTLQTQPYKGARDFYPEDKRVQKYMFSRMREVCERFGYEEYDAPILEPTELYLSKGNQEIIDEQTYTFLDRGRRSVTVRTEMTPSVSRMIAAKRQELAYPVRWYSIPNLWRYERPQRGRLREFWQLNVDIFGIVGLEAEHEIISVADRLMGSFGATRKMYTVLINSRKLTDYLFRDYLDLTDTQGEMLIRLVDKKQKLEPASFLAQVDAILAPTQRESGTLQKLVGLLDAKKVSDLPSQAQSVEAVQDIQKLLAMLHDSGIDNARFDISLMRGFDYYTDIVFEVVDTDPENNRSMFGGGRYDGLVAAFGVEPVPTVGFGMGDVTLENFLVSHKLLPPLAPEADVQIVLVGEGMYEKSLRLVNELREAGVNVAVDTSGRKLDKQLKAAEKRGIEQVLFVGENELRERVFEIKNLRTGQKATRSIERIATELLRERATRQDRIKGS
ncbi:MAG: histidyl-tRNA synthetase [Patescibacteria group bacterium]|nr:histidine--tRNA ligase [Candidatus Saccharibacteria bacterium]MDQ5963124.1 histidyl-tRNA synthetase [Patescibacteria group bacterium]